MAEKQFQLKGEDRLHEIARFWWNNRGSVSESVVMGKDFRGGDKAQMRRWLDAGTRPDKAFAGWKPRPNHLTATAVWDPETKTFTEPFDGRVWSEGGQLLDRGSTSGTSTTGAPDETNANTSESANVFTAIPFRGGFGGSILGAGLDGFDSIFNTRANQTLQLGGGVGLSPRDDTERLQRGQSGEAGVAAQNVRTLLGGS